MVTLMRIQNGHFSVNRTSHSFRPLHCLTPSMIFSISLSTLVWETVALLLVALLMRLMRLPAVDGCDRVQCCIHSTWVYCSLWETPFENILHTLKVIIGAMFQKISTFYKCSLRFDVSDFASGCQEPSSCSLHIGVHNHVLNCSFWFCEEEARIS